MMDKYDRIDCIYRLLGDERCRTCIRDYSNHFPNNLDCLRYRPARRVCGEAIVTLDKDICDKVKTSLRNSI